MKYQIGDIVQVYERDINKHFKAIITICDEEEDGLYFAKPLDGTTFDHYLFRTTGQCCLTDEDIIDDYFNNNEDLFTL